MLTYVEGVYLSIFRYFPVFVLVTRSLARPLTKAVCRSIYTIFIWRTIHNRIFLKFGIRMEMIGGHQKIDLYGIWTMDYKIIGFLQKRKTISVARNWDFFPGTFSQFWDLRGFRSSNTDDQSARGAAVHRRTDGGGQLHWRGTRASEWREQIPENRQK